MKEELALDYEVQATEDEGQLAGEDITKDGNATGRSIIGFVLSLFMFMQPVYGMHVARGH